MNNQLINNINSGAEFANELQFLAEQQRTILYEKMKDRLPDFIQSGSDVANVLQYLSPSQRTAVFDNIKPYLLNFINSEADRIFTLRYLAPAEASALNNLLIFIDQMSASEPAKQFAAALLEEDDEKIKKHFDALLQQNYQPVIYHLFFFEQQNPVTPLMNATAHLEPKWISKISDALGLRLNVKNKLSQKDVVEALKAYFPSAQPPRASNS